MVTDTQEEIIKVEQIDFGMIEAQDRAIIDKQIATAKAYPRNIYKAKDNIIAIASMDIDTAKSCGYALPRQGKTIAGPSVHLARIVVQQYGNVRADTRISSIDAKTITGQATVLDLENNVGIRIEVKRRITDSKGNRYNEDMIVMTGNAAIAIALRNAVYNVVPKPLWSAGYNAAQQLIVGDISDETKLIQKRQSAVAHFAALNVPEEALLKALSLKSTKQIKGEELKTLFGMAQAIDDGYTTIDELFFPEKLQMQEKKADLKENKAKQGEQANLDLP